MTTNDKMTLDEIETHDWQRLSENLRDIMQPLSPTGLQVAAMTILSEMGWQAEAHPTKPVGGASVIEDVARIAILHYRDRQEKARAIKQEPEKTD